MHCHFLLSHRRQSTSTLFGFNLSIQHKTITYIFSSWKNNWSAILLFVYVAVINYFVDNFVQSSSIFKRFTWGFDCDILAARKRETLFSVTLVMFNWFTMTTLSFLVGPTKKSSRDYQYFIVLKSLTSSSSVDVVLLHHHMICHIGTSLPMMPNTDTDHHTFLADDFQIDLRPYTEFEYRHRLPSIRSSHSTLGWL